MKHNHSIMGLILLELAMGVTATYATNGDFLIGIGPISRALGGTGIAAPQDAISAVFLNPAAMCSTPTCAMPQVDFSLTCFMPKVSAVVTNSTGDYHADGHDSIYLIPAIGMSMPLDLAGRWRMGFAAYGVSGMGVNYRSSSIQNNSFYHFGEGLDAPMVAGAYTELAMMKMAPSLAYSVTPHLSIGFAGHVDYATLDIGAGTKHDFGFGAQFGVVWKPIEMISVGLTYISAQSTTFDNVADFDSNGIADSLELEAPQQVALGIAWTTLDDRLLIEMNGRWLNWSDAKGYKDFDWQDEWVLGLGVQYKLIPNKLVVRCGYNYGTNPVKEHNGWNGAFGPGMNQVDVQGTKIPRYYYETFRTIGFPAIVQHHLTLGIGYQINECWTVNLSYVHAFQATLNERGTDPFGMPVHLQSRLYEDSIDLGTTWRF